MRRVSARVDVLIRPPEKRQSRIVSRILPKARADGECEERESGDQRPS